MHQSALHLDGGMHKSIGWDASKEAIFQKDASKYHFLDITCTTTMLDLYRNTIEIQQLSYANAISDHFKRGSYSISNCGEFKC